MEEKKTKRFKGLMIALGVVLTLIIAAAIVLPLCLTKSCKSSAKAKTYDITFVAGNCTCEYSQNLIKDVPSGTRVHVDGSSIEINGTTVAVRATPTEGESILHNYTFDHWSVEEGFKIKKDTEISAIFATTDKLYSFRIVATGGGQIIDESTSATQTEFFYLNAKSYIAKTLYTDQAQPVGEHLEIETTIDGQRSTYGFRAYCPEDSFYTYVFDGWYYNGTRLTYGTEMTGDIMIEGHFHKEEIDTSYIFDFEINTQTNNAVIVGAKSTYQFPNYEFDNLTIPRSYNGYPVTGIKNAALANLHITGSLSIPSSLAYIEELESVDSSIKLAFYGLPKINLEEGSSSFRLIDGVLYNYSFTEVITGTSDMVNYLAEGIYIMPSTVRYIWKSAFRGIPMASVVLPEGLTAVSKAAFSHTGLTSLSLPSTITNIDSEAFYVCNFASVSIPDSVITIERLAFSYNENLTSFHIGASLIGIDYDDIFWRCPNLASFTVSEDNANLSSYKGALYNKTMTELIAYPIGKGSVDPISELSPSLLTIGAHAFEECTFTEIHLPEGVETICNMGIHSCYNLTKVYLPSTINHLDGYCFQGCSNVDYMEFAGTVNQWNESVYKESGSRKWNYGLDKLTQVVCSDGVVEITE